MNHPWPLEAPPLSEVFQYRSVDRPTAENPNRHVQRHSHSNAFVHLNARIHGAWVITYYLVPTYIYMYIIYYILYKLNICKTHVTCIQLKVDIPYNLMTATQQRLYRRLLLQGKTGVMPRVNRRFQLTQLIRSGDLSTPAQTLLRDQLIHAMWDDILALR